MDTQLGARPPRRTLTIHRRLRANGRGLRDRRSRRTGGSGDPARTSAINPRGKKTCVNRNFAAPRSQHARQTHRFLIRRAEATHQDRSWVHEFPVDQLRVFAGTYACDQRAGLLVVDTPLTSSTTLPRAAVALSIAATVR